MISIIQFIFVVLLIFLLFCYILYTTDTKFMDDRKYLEVVLNNKAFRTLIMLLITFCVFEEQPQDISNYILGLLLLIAYVQSISSLQINYQDIKIK